MRPVNLIPPDERRGASRGAHTSTGAAVYVVLGLLALALLGALLVVTKGNSVNEQKGKLAKLTAEQQAAEAQQQKFLPYGTFEQTAQARFDAVYAAAHSRFNFERRLRQLTHAIPDDVVLIKLSANLSGDSQDGGEAGASSGGGSPTFTFEQACTTGGKPGVARMATRMRNLDGVTKVTIKTIEEGATCRGAPGSTGIGSVNTPAIATNDNQFDMTVQFSAQAGAGSSAGAGGGASAASAVAPTAIGQAQEATGKSDAANQAAGADQPGSSSAGGAP